jgi:hypothetical protein
VSTSGPKTGKTVPRRKSKRTSRRLGSRHCALTSRLLRNTRFADKPYNTQRPHQALGYATPAEVYFAPDSYGAKPATWEAMQPGD